MQEDCVVIPNFGGFVTHYRPAILEPSKNLIIPPGKSVSFNAKLSKNDGLLAKTIAEKTSMSYNDALKAVDLKVTEWLKLVNKAHFLELEGIGSFVLSKEGKLIFEQFNESNFANSAFGLTNVRAQVINHTSIVHKIERGLNSKKAYPTVYKTLKSASIAAAVIGVCATIGWQLTNTDNKHLMNLNPVTWFKNDATQPQPAVKAGKQIEFSKNVKVAEVDGFIDTKEPVAVANNDVVVANEKVAKGEEEIKVGLSAVEAPLSTGKKEVVASKAQATETQIIGKYQVIAGCFGVKSNAEKMLKTLKNTGFPDAQLAGYSKSGLYRVAYGTYTTRIEALKALANAKLSHSANAWLAKK